MKGTFDRSRSLHELKEIHLIEQLDVLPFSAVKSDDFYVLVQDPEPTSNFFFAIEDIFFTESNDVYYDILYAPSNEYSTAVDRTRIRKSDFKDVYPSWVKLITAYSALLDEAVQDSITEGYEREFADFFELTDEDADTHSFETNRQEGIDLFLQEVANRLKQYKEQTSFVEDVVQDIDRLLQDIERLRETQNRQTKRQVVGKLRNIYARFCKAVPVYTRVIGSEVVKALLTDGAKEVLTEIGKLIIGQ